MTLEEIRNLLRFRDAPDENCSEVDALLEEHIEHVGNRMKELRFLQKNLRRLRSRCEQARAPKTVEFFSRWEAPERAQYDRRMLSTGTVACTRRINDPAIPLPPSHAIEIDGPGRLN